ncbi:MAG TPA: hypothetical protein VK524_10755 [Polyangiaceae bacterium]|nr:hypothetical protein [Polyangiaceae bacterium]
MKRSRGALICVLAFGAACARAERSAPLAESSAEPAPSAAKPHAAASVTEREPSSCGAGCQAFATPQAAFAAVLARDLRVLAIGEAHAQKGATARSATARFSELLLPQLRARASHLVLEIWVQTGKCGAVERRVEQQQQPVVSGQAPQNLNDFVALGTRAKALGIEPQPLVPSCAEYDAIGKAGAADIARMLEMISRRTQRDIVRLLDAQERVDAGAKWIVAYGGALHNDLRPRPGREAWSFGPALARRTAGHYVELDLVVPEFVKDTEVWRAQPWYAHFKAAPRGDRTLLLNPSPDSYALVFAAGS